MRRLVATIAAMATVALAGCTHPTYFIQPLTPPGTGGYDERLLGTWTARMANDAILTLVIEPAGSDRDDGLLDISMAASSIEPGKGGSVTFAWFKRAAYPSVIDGEPYYNVWATPPVQKFVLMDSSGQREPDLDDIDWLIAPASAEKEYWIAKPVFSGNGELWLRFVVIDDWGQRCEVPTALTRSRSIHGQGDSYWIEKCVGGCDFARADISPDLLIELIRTNPVENVLNLSSGPFVRVGDTVPELEFLPE